MSFRLTATRKFHRTAAGGVSLQSGLAFAVKSLADKAAGQVMASAEAAITAAAEGTPKWSGRATMSWHFTRVKGAQYTVVRPSDEPAGELKFPDGLEDSAAAALNREVVERELHQVCEWVAEALLEGRDVRFWLVNSEAYSAMWLDEAQATTAAAFLRAVNHDFYTMNDIINEAQAAKGAAGMGLVGGWF